MTADPEAAPAAADTTRANPYVGPRSLGRKDGIYGRDREIRELRASILAHRIVLLYSQSGAGKTSLVEAGLRHELEDLEFQVFPTIRVGYEPQPSEEGGDTNRYRLSVLSSIEESRPPDEQLDHSELTTIGLDEYFQRLDETIPDRDPCLVFDQFEEVFTLDPTDRDQKEAFLRELGEALANKGRWALFSMREDFIAQLDPYLALFPNQLATRYRIDLLDPTAAKQAIRKPAAAAGVDFDKDAADHLVDDLRRIQIQRGTRSTMELGSAVEPVQLQVVCNRLWANLAPDATMIGSDDVTTAGSVNEALADFYVAQVTAAAASKGTTEHEIRDWFEEELITPDGFRTQARTGPGRTGDAVVRELQSGHLVRADRIRGTEWYELSHDRFVEPIKVSNADFRRKRRGRRQRRLYMLAAAAASILVVLAVVNYVSARSARQETAAANEQIARANERADIVAEAVASQEYSIDSHDAALPLAIAAEEAARSLTPETVGAVIEAKTALRNSGLEVNLVGHSGPVFAVAYGSDGTRIVTAGDDTTAKIWDADTGNELLTLQGHTGPVFGVAYNDDGTQVATASLDTTAKLWNPESGEVSQSLATGPVFGVEFNDEGTELATAGLDGTANLWDPDTGDLKRILVGHEGPVFGVAFNDDDARVATASLDGTASVWNPEANAELLTLTGHVGEVWRVAYNNDGTRVATAGNDATAKIWDADNGEKMLDLTGHAGALNSVTFSGDGARVATTSVDSTAKIWDAETGDEQHTLIGHENFVRGVAFNPDNTRIVTTSDDKTSRVWNAETGELLRIDTGHDGPVLGVDWSNDGTRLATASNDATARIWDAETGSELATLRGHVRALWGVAFSHDGTQLATASEDGTAKLWDIDSGTELLTLKGHNGAVWVVAFNDDGTQLATASADGTAKLWDVSTGAELLTITGHAGSVEAVAFKPDGTVLATTSIDETAKLWDVSVDDPCALVERLVTIGELREALGGNEPTACTDLRP